MSTFLKSLNTIGTGNSSDHSEHPVVEILQLSQLLYRVRLPRTAKTVTIPIPIRIRIPTTIVEIDDVFVETNMHGEDACTLYLPYGQEAGKLILPFRRG
jgi:hypothetical protein